MQLQIDCIEWVLEKIEVNKIPNDRLDGHIRSMIKNLEKRKDKAMIRSDTERRTYAILRQHNRVYDEYER